MIHFWWRGGGEYNLLFLLDGGNYSRLGATLYEDELILSFYLLFHLLGIETTPRLPLLRFVSVQIQILLYRLGKSISA
jgi:hypothetical protein